MKKLTLITLFLLAFIFAKSQSPVNKYYSNGLLMESGFIKNGKCDSTWTKYDGDGNVIAKAFYKEGIKIGTWEIFADTKIMQIVYVEGIKTKYCELNNKREIIKTVLY